MGYHWCNQQALGFYQGFWASDHWLTNVLDSRAFLNPILGLRVPSHFRFHWWLAGSGAYMAILVDDWQSVYPSFAVKSNLGLLRHLSFIDNWLWLTPEIPESFTQVDILKLSNTWFFPEARRSWHVTLGTLGRFVYPNSRKTLSSVGYHPSWVLLHLRDSRCKPQL